MYNSVYEVFFFFRPFFQGRMSAVELDDGTKVRGQVVTQSMLKPLWVPVILACHFIICFL